MCPGEQRSQAAVAPAPLGLVKSWPLSKRCSQTSECHRWTSGLMAPGQRVASRTVVSLVGGSKVSECQGVIGSAHKGGGAMLLVSPGQAPSGD